VAAANSLADFTSKDPSWQRALAIVQLRLALSAPNWNLLRLAWNGAIEQKELIRMLGFSRLNLNCLLDAAMLKPQEGAPDAQLLQHALETLGIRYTAVVLGVNLACAAILNSKPPSLWKRLFQEMMTWIEIGYKIGTKVPELGVEGGALMGFSKGIGLGLLLAENATAFKKWYNAPNGPSTPFPAAVFGCEPFQVSAFALQQLGYGHETAIGAALASSRLKPQNIEYSRRTKFWHAAILWIEALREGRNYPADPNIRQVFPEIAPAPQGQSQNLTLEVLYTEVAKVRSDGSSWTWHLPKPGYEETMEYLGLRPI